jgi:NADP-reducing hydrogenase subunit HndB
MAKLTLEALHKLRDSKKVELRKRESEGKDIQVIVAMDTCGLAAGSRATLNAFIDALDADKALADKVLVRLSPCMGHCNAEPTVEVLAPGMPGALYGKVDPATAREIIKTHIVGGKVLASHILTQPDVAASGSIG